MVCAFGVLMPALTLAQSWPELTTPPATQGGGERDAAVIVSIERYASVAPVPGAEANGRDWYVYLAKGRRVPPAKISWLKNNEGAREMIEEAIAKRAAQVQPGGALWFVFIGHGAPAKDQRDGVLVGFDAQQNATMLYARSLPQSRVVQVATDAGAQRVVAIIDACFSGQTAGGSLVPGLQPLVVVQATAPPAATVLSAGKGNEFAGPLPFGDRPAFSYLVLGALRGWGDANGDGKVTANEAVQYSRDALSTLLKGRSQTPQAQGVGLGAALARVGRKEAGPDLVDMVVARARPKPTRARPTPAPAPPPIVEARPAPRPRPAVVSAPATDMITIPAGVSFVGCSHSDCGKTERPERRVQLAAYQIDRTEVTVGAYRQCVQQGACRAPALGPKCPADMFTWTVPGGDNLPVNCIDWNAAGAYCRWAGKRLPTEAEWEKAARGGDRRLYPWGQRPLSRGDSPVGNFADATMAARWPRRKVMSWYDDGYATASPVGAFPGGASPYGLVDVAGNLAEWVAERHPRKPAYRIIKGSSFGLRNTGLRLTHRFYLKPDTRYARLGVRCAR